MEPPLNTTSLLATQPTDGGFRTPQAAARAFEGGTDKEDIRELWSGMGGTQLIRKGLGESTSLAVSAGERTTNARPST